jgi:ribosomal protein S12 methylthiotransferase
VPGSYFLETLGCPKNAVDSDKLARALEDGGLLEARSVEEADLVVVNTCAFIEAAREESIETILELAGRRRPGARLVVTGCLAERYGVELAAALPEVDEVAGIGVPIAGVPSRKAPGVPVEIGAARRARARAGSAGHEGRSRLELLELPRRPGRAPWAYLKVAEGCNRRCGFCAIPSFRGPQRSRRPEAVLEEAEALGVEEVVLVAQDLVSYGRDLGRPGALVELVEALAARVRRVRLLYLYPSGLDERLVDAILGTGVPYFDLSLQHASGRLLRRMRRFGDRERFLERIRRIRSREPAATLRSSFIVGYPGEREEDHEELLGFLEEAELDWAGFFLFSPEEGTLAATLPGAVPRELALERLNECSELQDAITARRRAALVGSALEVLVDAPGSGRSVHEAPEIDGVVRLPPDLPVGSFVTVEVLEAVGVDLVAAPPAARAGGGRLGSASLAPEGRVRLV